MRTMWISRRRTVPSRTIVSAIAMLAGIVIMGLGYFQNEQVLIYVGVPITLGGVLTEAVFGLFPAARERRRNRIARV